MSYAMLWYSVFPIRIPHSSAGAHLSVISGECDSVPWVDVT